jgi:hypothetical protein
MHTKMEVYVSEDSVHQQIGETDCSGAEMSEGSDQECLGRRTDRATPKSQPSSREMEVQSLP